jgi:uroporphyrinogen-III synthase
VSEQRYLSPSIDFSHYDYLIFTSKKGVEAAERIDGAWRGVPALAVGEATAKRIGELGGSVAYVCQSGYGADLAEAIAKKFDPKKRYLYLRPRKVSSDLGAILRKRGFAVDEAIVYETLCRKLSQSFRPPKGSVLIFGAPSAVECFLQNFGWDASYIPVAIGERTKAALERAVEGRVYVAPKTSFAAAVEFARGIRV